MNRREFVAQGITAGFALATLPVTAWAVTTSPDGLITESVSIPTTGEGGAMPAFLARPKGAGPFPTIVVIHEIFGVHEYIQDVCRRFAHLGYLAIAPSLFFREGDVTKIADVEKIMPRVQKVAQKQVWSDLEAVLRWLPQKPANLGKLGITGFCWGGGVVWTTCARNPHFKAGVAWYGRLTGTPSPAQQEFPLDIGATLATPVLGLYGGKDTGIPVADVDKMREALKQGHSQSEIIVYPEASHGFHADYRPSYNEKAATDGWNHAVAWFKDHGVA